MYFYIHILYLTIKTFLSVCIFAGYICEDNSAKEKAKCNRVSMVCHLLCKEVEMKKYTCSSVQKETQ